MPIFGIRTKFDTFWPINWYYPMPEEGFSFFEIRTPLENVTLHKPKGPPESCKFGHPSPPPFFYAPSLPHHWGGGGVGVMVDK